VRVETPDGLTLVERASVQEWGKTLGFDQLELF